MAATLLRLMTLLAFVMMPFTMPAAAAEAQAMPHAMVAGHCDEHPDQPGAPATDMAQCMLMCAALPAGQKLAATPLTIPKAPRQLALVEPIHGIILDIATPPPRVA